MYSFGGEREVSNHDSIKHFVYHSNCHINIVLNKNKKLLKTISEYTYVQ